jgi:predicted nucleic acid-binding protein
VSVLVDTNVLLRRLEPLHEHHRHAVDATARLVESAEPVHVTPQNIAEFWAVVTRPVARNGLGLALAIAIAEIGRIERVFALLPDHPGIYDQWKHLVATHAVMGDRVYDARLVAAITLHGVRRILTFNVEDFTRYGIEVIHPSAVL